MTIDSFQFAFLSVTLLLPGYIASNVLAARRARRRESTEIEFFRWLALGTACNAPWIAALFVIVGDALSSEDAAWQYGLEHRWPFVGAWLFAVLLWPWLVGRFLAMVQERSWWVASQSPLSGATAWDSKFMEIQQQGGGWVFVLLIGGDWVAGEMVRGSYASIEPGERDLYIAKVDVASFDDRFPGIGPEGGILIPAEQVKLIRYWGVTEMGVADANQENHDVEG